MPEPVALRSRLALALDVDDQVAALRLAHELRPWFGVAKVGLELYSAAGPDTVAALAEEGFGVFLDLKLHDIPNTVAGAVKSASACGASMLTLHASGGPQMMQAALEAAATLPNAPKLLAVTVLTSMNAQQLHATGVMQQPAEQVELLARMGLAAGMRGFVCSAQETARLRDIAGADVTLVIPGIRPAGVALDDQKRVATPADALRNGANFLVVGRPIVQAENPAMAAASILTEMEAALA